MDNENKSSLKVEDIVFLQGLQHELDIQPTDGQAAPRFWVVADTRKMAGSPDCCDGADLYDVDSCSIAIPDVTLESMVKFFKEKYSDVLYDKMLDIKEANDFKESFSNKVYALYKVASETEELELVEHLFDEDDVLWNNVEYKKNGTFKRTVKPILWEAVNGYYNMESYGWRTECLRIEADDDTTAYVRTATITVSAC